MAKLTAKQLEVFGGIDLTWRMPMEFGGNGGNSVSAIAKALMKKGLVDRRKSCRHGVRVNVECRCKGSCLYRLSAEGEKLSAELWAAQMKRWKARER